MPRKKGDHDGTPLPSALSEPSSKKKAKDPLSSAVETPDGLLPPEKEPKP